MIWHAYERMMVDSDDIMERLTVLEYTHTTPAGDQSTDVVPEKCPSGIWLEPWRINTPTCDTWTSSLRISPCGQIESTWPTLKSLKT